MPSEAEAHAAGMIVDVGQPNKPVIGPVDEERERFAECGRIGAERLHEGKRIVPFRARHRAALDHERITMTVPFAPLLRTLAALALAACAPRRRFAQTPPPDDNGTLPAGGKFKECHGYIRHVSDLNIKVHCIDGNASDQSFLYLPKYANAARREERPDPRPAARHADSHFLHAVARA